ncbi:MAG: pilus assembly protein TadC, partial [Novosphingobium sp. 16-62-11]
MIQNPPGPTLLGFDVYLLGSILIGIAAAAVLLAIYAAITVRDPMTKRVKALNERREQLKAGIVTNSARKRTSIVRRNQTTDQIRGFLESLKVLQDSQLSVAQQRLAQAGIRKKEWAVAIILGRMIGPIVLGIIGGLMFYMSDMFPDWTPFKRFMGFAACVIFGYKSTDIFVTNLVSKRTNEIRKGLPDALDLLVICAEAGLTVDAAF